jgi:probable HAF family extracellular repeat protein
MIKSLGMRYMLMAGASVSMMALASEPAIGQTVPAGEAPAVTVVLLPPAEGASGPDSAAELISGDGLVVFGRDSRSEVIWRNGVPERITGLTGDFLNGASFDGSIVVGSTDSSGFDERRGFYWTRSGGRTFLPDVDPLQPVVDAAATSSDGTYIAVTSVAIAPEARPGFHECDATYRCIYKAYRWSQAGGYESLGDFGPPAAGGGTSGLFAQAISGDGNVIAGDIVIDALSSVNGGAFVWRSGTGLARLPFLSNAPAGGAPRTTTVTDINRDGSVIVGSSIDADGHRQAVYWSGGTVIGLGFLPGTTAADFAGLPYYAGTEAQGVSADGSVIVGDGDLIRLSGAWRWTAVTGMQDLNQIVRDAGLSLDGFVLSSASGISDDGTVITGNAFGPSASLGYILQLAQITRTQLIVQIRLPGQTLTSIVNQSFSTEVSGILNGQTVFSRNFADAIDTAAGLAALNDARAALRGNGLRRIVIGAPTLVSNTTTVLGSTSTTVEVPNGTQVTTATINTRGPATVITGDLGTCATAAIAGAAPTGCSLPGTPVVVSAGLLNSNIYTNTINTVTPTTTTSVKQLITARWQVAATAGNQFGTVHALAGRVGFDRGDRLLARTIALGAEFSDDTAIGERAGAGVTAGGSQLAGDGRVRIFGEYFGTWQHLSADPSAAVARVSGKTNGLTAGVGFDSGDALRFGAVVDYGKTDMDVRDPIAPEALDVRLTQVGAYAGWMSGRLSLSAAGSYGFGNIATAINAPDGSSSARRDIHSWAIGAGVRYGIIDHGPAFRLHGSAGVRHASVNLERFTETGGTTPLAGLSGTVSRTRFYTGLELSGSLFGVPAIREWGYARAAYDSGDRNGTASVVFAANPGLGTFEAVGPGTGRFGGEVGVGIDAQVTGALHFSAGYEGAFRDGETVHRGRAGISLAF